jgi:hypothetical protein
VTLTFGQECDVLILLLRELTPLIKQMCVVTLSPIINKLHRLHSNLLSRILNQHPLRFLLIPASLLRKIERSTALSRRVLARTNGIAMTVKTFNGTIHYNSLPPGSAVRINTPKVDTRACAHRLQHRGQITRISYPWQSQEFSQEFLGSVFRLSRFLCCTVQFNAISVTISQLRRLF